MPVDDFTNLMIVDAVTLIVIAVMAVKYIKEWCDERGRTKMKEQPDRPCNRCANWKEYTHRGVKYKACDKWICEPEIINEEETPREAAGVSLEVAPVQQEKTIWGNPTHQGKK